MKNKILSILISIVITSLIVGLPIVAFFFPDQVIIGLVIALLLLMVTLIYTIVFDQLKNRL